MNTIPMTEEIECAVKIIAKESTAPDKETPDWMETDIRRGMMWMLGRIWQTNANGARAFEAFKGACKENYGGEKPMSLDDDLQKYDFVQSVLSDLRRITLKENGFTEKTWAGLKSDLANAVVDGTATEHGTIQIVETPAYLHKSSQAIGTRKEIRLIRKERT